MATIAESKAWTVFLAFPLLILICETLGLGVGKSSVEQYLLKSRGTTTDGTAFFTQYKPAGRAGGAYYVRFASSWMLTALGVFEIAPLLTVLLGLGCVIVVAGLSPLWGLPGTKGSQS